MEQGEGGKEGRGGEETGREGKGGRYDLEEEETKPSFGMDMERKPNLKERN